MAIQLSTNVRNARLDAIETAIGASAVLKIRSGAQPATVATADSGTVLATLTLPADWLAAAAAGTKSKAGTWTDASADANGTAEHFRIYASDGTTAHIQGSVGVTTQDMVVDTVTFVAAAPFTINSFVLTEANA